MEVTYTSGSTVKFYVSDVNVIQDIVINRKGGMVEMSLYDVPRQSAFWTWMPVIVGVVLLVVLMVILMGGVGGGAGGGGSSGRVMNFGKSRARMMTEKDQKFTFKDVAGLEEEKEDMAEIVDFLKDPAKIQ